MKKLTRIVRPLRGGQITIPREFRKALNLDKYDMLQVTGDYSHLATETQRHREMPL